MSQSDSFGGLWAPFSETEERLRKAKKAHYGVYPDGKVVIFFDPTPTPSGEIQWTTLSGTLTIPQADRILFALAAQPGC